MLASTRTARMVMVALLGLVLLALGYYLSIYSPGKTRPPGTRLVVAFPVAEPASKYLP